MLKGKRIEIYLLGQMKRSIVLPQMTQCGLWPQPNSTTEDTEFTESDILRYRSEQISMCLLKIVQDVSSVQRVSQRVKEEVILNSSIKNCAKNINSIHKNVLCPNKYLSCFP